MQRIGNYVQSNNYRPSFKANINWESLGVAGKLIVSNTASQEIRVSRKSIEELALQLPENHEYKFNNIDLSKLVKKLNINLAVDGKSVAQQSVSIANRSRLSLKTLLTTIGEHIKKDAENYKNFKSDIDCYKNSFMN